MGQDDDLSEFERRRLENIKRNESFLASMGLGPAKKGGVLATAKAIKEEERKKRRRQENPDASPKRKDKGRKISSNVAVGTRSSARTRKAPVLFTGYESSEERKKKAISFLKRTPNGESITSDDEADEEFAIDYERMPEASEELDDFEFKAFVIIRKVRSAYILHRRFSRFYCPLSLLVVFQSIPFQSHIAVEAQTLSCS
jgi:hypothetical protein